ncbi:unnamed protein product, partial [Ectocarpus sp. 8 AP-2014]
PPLPSGPPPTRPSYILGSSLGLISPLPPNAAAAASEAAAKKAPFSSPLSPRPAGRRPLPPALPLPSGEEAPCPPPPPPPPLPDAAASSASPPPPDPCASLRLTQSAAVSPPPPPPPADKRDTPPPLPDARVPLPEGPGHTSSSTAFDNFRLTPPLDADDASSSPPGDQSSKSGCWKAEAWLCAAAAAVAVAVAVAAAAALPELFLPFPDAFEPPLAPREVFCRFADVLPGADSDPGSWFAVRRTA